MSALESLSTLTTDNRREIKQFFKFATVGVGGTVTHLGLFNILMLGLHVTPWIANTIGFCTAIMQNFFLNRYWTFPHSRSQPIGKQLGQFYLVSILGLGINLVVFNTVVHFTESFWSSVIANPTLAHAITNNFALGCAILVVLFWNFFVNRLWTFRRR